VSHQSLYIIEILFSNFKVMLSQMGQKRLWMKITAQSGYAHHQLELYWEEENCQKFTKPLNYQFFRAPEPNCKFY
jgi:hypothetical protein